MPCHSICDFALSITTSNVVWWNKNVKTTLGSYPHFGLSIRGVLISPPQKSGCRNPMDVLIDFHLLFTFEDRGPLFHKSAHSLHQVLAWNGRCTFLRNIMETWVDAVIPAVKDHLLGSLNRKRRTGRYLRGDPFSLFIKSLPILAYSCNEPHLKGLLRSKIPTR